MHASVCLVLGATQKKVQRVRRKLLYIIRRKPGTARIAQLEIEHLTTTDFRNVAWSLHDPQLQHTTSQVCNEEAKDDPASMCR